MKVYGGSGEGVWWEGWCVLVGVSCVVGEVEVCWRVGKVSVGGVVVCGRGGGVWEGWRCVGGMEVCGNE